MADFQKLCAEVLQQGKDAEEQACLILEDKSTLQLEGDQWQQYLSLFDRDVRRQVQFQQQQQQRQQPPPPASAGMLTLEPPPMLGRFMNWLSLVPSSLQVEL